MQWRVLIASPLVVATLFLPTAALAGIFNPHLIITDEELRNSSAMSYDEVLRFLRQKGGLADTFDIDPADGLLKNAAQLIYDAAGRYRVNPKYLLVLVQKESGAVETKKPAKRQLDWATGYSLCDSCSRTSASAVRNQGLGKQIDAGAGWVKWYYENVGISSAAKVPGTTYSISKLSVTPRNLATAALYSYTPHLHGNRLLWSIWNNWFATGINSIDYPDGSLVRNVKTGAVALIQNGKFRPVISRSVLLSRFNETNVIELNEYDFSALQSRMGSPVRFADYSLVRVEDGSTYLLAGTKRRKIVSPQVFAKIGFNPEEVEIATAADIADYAEGEPITMASAVPTGYLAQDAKTGAVFYVEADIRYPIVDRAILAANFPGRPILPMAPADLAAFKAGAPVTFTDGALVRAAGSPSVYVVSGGKKRFIPDEDVFNGLGYRWDMVRVTTPKALGLLETGEPLVPSDR